MASEPHLHWAFNNEHVLFPAVTLTSFWSFLVACVLVSVICLSERFLSFVLEKQWMPRICRRSRISLALWRTGLYSIATFLRLCYMLAGMTFHIGLMFCIVFSLSIAQFFIELQKLPRTSDSVFRNPRGHESSLPLLSEEESTTYPLKSVNKTRPRSKSKPDDIFIHPTESNIARADAVALELGLAGETDRVQAYARPNGSPAWEIGRGRDIAREMLRGHSAQHKRISHDTLFYADDESDSGSEERK